MGRSLSLPHLLLTHSSQSHPGPNPPINATPNTPPTHIGEAAQCSSLSFTSSLYNHFQGKLRFVHLSSFLSAFSNKKPPKNHSLNPSNKKKKKKKQTSLHELYWFSSAFCSKFLSFLVLLALPFYSQYWVHQSIFVSLAKFSPYLSELFLCLFPLHYFHKGTIFIFYIFFFFFLFLFLFCLGHLPSSHKMVLFRFSISGFFLFSICVF